MMAMDTRPGAGLPDTERSEVPVTFPEAPLRLAVMIVVPWVEPAVARPVELMVATEVSLELQVAWLVMC
jgi:hypothetical protein